MRAAASTPNSLFFKRKVVAPLRLGVTILSLATLISLPTLSAHAEPGKCIPQSHLFGNYENTEKQVSVGDIPFLVASGAKTSLNAYKGKGIVLNFWATWCAPCVREMPQLDRLSAFVRENNIEVLTISEDMDGLKSAPKFYKTNNLHDLPILADIKGRLMRAFKASGLPLTILIDANGKQVGRVVGAAEWDSIEIVEFVRNCLSTTK